MVGSSELVALVEKYGPHLKEVRRRVLFSFLVFIVATVAGFVFYERIISFLIGGLSLERVNIVFTSPFQFINLAISSGITVGCIVALPFFIAQVLLFLRPAMRKKEYQAVIRFLPFSVVLFSIGFLFGTLIMRWQIQIFLEKSISLGIGNVIDISHLLSIILLTSALMGIGFQFPLLLLLLMRFGILKHQQLSEWRAWFYLGSFVFTVILPADSVLVDALLLLPLIILFEITLVLGGAAESRRLAGGVTVSSVR